MALNFSPITKTIEFAGGDITVRGLSVPDLVQLVQVHKDSATTIYDKFVGRDPDSFTDTDAANVALDLITVFPAIVAHTIALAADEPNIDLVATLPIDLQIAALEHIADLTFAMQGGPKNFVETVRRMAGGVSGLVKSQKNLPN